ncbi:hypothetical protein G5714_004274 [Onychostoma macrolepis]|uniref:Uncharacterized protein n=1 Tax=Onychostoma macrolepis TaxID=369639 RepID=A0A7J6D4A5_9TELE|nr:hypothetical protein G5714_004274 [Onychostoma macrolepis]
METANHSMEMEKHQIAISSSSKRDKGTFPKDTPCSESLACYRVGSNRSTRSESPACKGASGLISMEELSFEQIDLFARETVDNAVSDTEDLPGVVSQDAIIDLTEEDEEEEHSPGPSNADTQKRPREADASPTAPERKKGQVAVVAPTRTVEEAVDDGDRERMNNVQRWTDTQLNEWERASWNSKGSDELPPRGRQTPFAFQDLAEEEVETESLPEDRQNSVQIVERIDALREELINRQDSFFSEVLKRQDTFFNELLNRMDAQDARAHEQQVTGVSTRSKAHEKVTLQPDSLNEDEREERGEHVQVSVPDGTVMVFRPWNEKDLKKAMMHLPHPKVSGEKFANDLDLFCQEFSPTLQGLKRLLMLKLGATDWHKIKPHYPTGNAQRKKNKNNEAYRLAVTTLCQRIETDFPVRVNTTSSGT